MIKKTIVGILYCFAFFIFPTLIRVNFARWGLENEKRLAFILLMLFTFSIYMSMTFVGDIVFMGAMPFITNFLSGLYEWYRYENKQIK